MKAMQSRSNQEITTRTVPTRSRSHFWRLLQLAFPIRNWMILAALLGSATIASGVGLAATSAYLISAAALHPSIAALQIAIVGVRFFGIARGVFRYLERLISHKATFRLLANLRVWFYNALEPLLPTRIISQEDGMAELRSGDLLRRAVADIDLLQNFYVRILAPPVVAVLIGLAMWIFLGAFGTIFGLIYVIFFLLASVGIPLLTHVLSRALGKEMVETRAELHAHMTDSIQGIADLIAYGQEEQQLQAIRSLNTRLNRLQAWMTQISGMQTSLTNLLMNVMTWTILLFAIPTIRAGHLDPVFMALLVLASLASFEIVLPLAGAFQQVGSSLQAASRLFEIVDAEPEVQDPTNPSPRAENYSLAVEHLSFRYHEAATDALHDISFTLPAKGFIAIVGPSGSGKSTLIHLLLRYWNYQHGHIQLGGHPLRDYAREDLYKLISVIEQDTHLFNTTIRENLMLARAEATDKEIEEAARQAQIHDFIQTLPRGYDTQVGEQGLRLSGGERQRIAIARAFLKNSPLLFLDEPTINLDAIAERGILHALRKLATTRTTILVTHRLIELDMADEILVLQKGHIIERGKHHELLQAKGLYWQMLDLNQKHAIEVAAQLNYQKNVL
jgi:ATP-binding cassette subfamily C protein CydC